MKKISYCSTHELKITKKEAVPADLVAFTHLIHPIRESTKSSKEDGHGAGSLGRDPTGVTDRCEATGRGAVLKNGHILHASHPGLIPNHSLRHLWLYLCKSTLKWWRWRKANQIRPVSLRSSFSVGVKSKIHSGTWIIALLTLCP